MSKNQFIEICEKYAVHPAIALENNGVREAVKSNDMQMLEEILSTEF